MAAPRAAISSKKICCRYRVFFYFCFIALGLQFFIGFNFYRFQSHIVDKTNTVLNGIKKVQDQLNIKERNHSSSQSVSCSNVSKEAQSAIKRAKTENCKKEIVKISCLNDAKKLYPQKLSNLCQSQGNHTAGSYIGCYKDSQTERDLSNVGTKFNSDNSPQKCLEYCTTGGYQYAGLQYKVECWCGNTYNKYGDLPETSCQTSCPGNQTETCGGYNAQRIFATGLTKKTPVPATLVTNEAAVSDQTPVRIAFVLTVNGRAVRQVLRLINILYRPQHYYFIHVDNRSEYMFQELLPLEKLLPNVHLTRSRFATIWGGASLLQAHLTFIRELLDMGDWAWDYYINLSESDYPIKRVEQLSWFLTKYKGNNFLKSHGRETHLFMKKQGYLYLFHECDNHLWRIGQSPVPAGIRVDGGSDWVGLHREFCEYAVSSSDRLVIGLKEFYRYCLLPVESFFHTLLLNSEYCERIVDNNLHLTNWKRKQGCKCQHKNQVDWCGCSPNVFKSDDLQRLMSYKLKPVFFARKFEPVINMDIINSLDALLGMDISELPALIHYWHNDYHYLDPPNARTDTWMSFMSSLVRRARGILAHARSTCTSSHVVILESHILNVADSFYRYLIKFNTSLPGLAEPVSVESQFSYRQHYLVLDPLGPIGRLITLEVGSDFDPKEQIFRNYPKFLGPESDVRLRHVWRYGSDFIIGVAWVDPTGEVASYQDVTVGKESLIDAQNPKLKSPLRPGVWKVKILYRLKVCAEVQFLILPFSIYKGKPLTRELVSQLHNGPPEGKYGLNNYSDISETLGLNSSKAIQRLSVINGQRVGNDLEAWIDQLTMEFWSVQDACATVSVDNICAPMEKCKDMAWSSFSPDPKSDISPKHFSYWKNTVDTKI
ncbi:xylosyltransferase oxt-like isoform X2 [Mya arenaria]|uniref:xylosyltransferase oxt-like isoform X2 n=1 Tax=Mya arenaria TaxID=6604 RepID=UPI0022E10CDB|nr:xylosyltransferase oxt-like isoform X2 [Mya arenaria]